MVQGIGTRSFGFGVQDFKARRTEQVYLVSSREGKFAEASRFTRHASPGKPPHMHGVTSTDPNIYYGLQYIQ